LGLYIGIAGISFEREENLEMIKQIPLNRLIISTDSPFCPIKNAFAGSKYIKTKFPLIKVEDYRIDHLIIGRNEPCSLV